MGLSDGEFGGREGGEVLLEACWVGKHTTNSLGEGCKVGCHRRGVEKNDVGGVVGRWPVFESGDM